MIKDELEVKDEELVEEELAEEKVDAKEEKKEEVQNIDFTIFNKKKFSINGNPDKIIELDPSDLMIVSRVKEEYPKLEKLQRRAAALSDKTKGLDDKQLIDVTGQELKEIDEDMRKSVNNIFDYDVCSVCVPTGSLYSPVNGRFKYEHLVETLIKLYDENLTKEYKKIQERLAKHTSKYSKR